MISQILNIFLRDYYGEKCETFYRFVNNILRDWIIIALSVGTASVGCVSMDFETIAIIIHNKFLCASLIRIGTD